MCVDPWCAVCLFLGGDGVHFLENHVGFIQNHILIEIGNVFAGISVRFIWTIHYTHVQQVKLSGICYSGASSMTSGIKDIHINHIIN